VAGLAALLALVAAVSVAWISALGPAAPAPARSPEPLAAPRPTSLALVVRGSPAPLVAVVVAGADPAVFAIPPELSLELVGRGSSSTADLAALPGDEMRVALANALGAWIDHYGVTDLERLAAIVDHMGGLAVSLPARVTLAGEAVGPGSTTLVGPEVAEFLTVGGPNAFTRWETVLAGLMRTPPALIAGDLLESDEDTAAADVLIAATGADLATFPTELVVGTVRVPAFEELDALVAGLFGRDSPPVPVVVLNGNGEPGVGADIAAELVPRGFRIVISRNAESFGHEVTEVIADGGELVPAAEEVVEALGVGRVEVSGVPSGLGDITIVVGRDYSS
jgi:hypothetical protein